MKDGCGPQLLFWWQLLMQKPQAPELSSQASEHRSRQSAEHEHQAVAELQVVVAPLQVM